MLCISSLCRFVYAPLGAIVYMRVFVLSVNRYRSSLTTGPI